MYLSFWSLSLYDISVPTEKYEIELKRLRERSKLLMLSAPPANIDPKKAAQLRSDETKKLLTG